MHDIESYHIAIPAGVLKIYKKLKQNCLIRMIGVEQIQYCFIPKPNKVNNVR